MSRPIVWTCLLCACTLLHAAPVRGDDLTHPAGHWKLDGNAQDSAAPPHEGKLLGRAQFLDSIIGGSGQSLWCNGVDTALEVSEPPAMAEGNFTLSLWICPLDLRPSGIFAADRGKGGWSLELFPNRGLRLHAGGKSLNTPGGAIHFQTWSHVAITAASNGHVVLYLNGAVSAEGDAGDKAGGNTLVFGKTDSGPAPFTGLLDDVRIYPGALSADEIRKLTDSGLPWIRLRPQATAPFNGHFQLQDNDVVVFTGGEDMLAAQSSGYLETLLTVASAPAAKHVLFRDMAWEADTVFDQWRIVNFGPWSEQFQRFGATVLFAQFGQMESMEGRQGLERFVAAYEKLLDEFGHRTQRIVLLSPTPFESAAPPLPDLAGHNADLRLYVDAEREIARKRGLLFVDLFTPLQQRAPDKPLTRDGIHLLPRGRWIVADQTARQLGVVSRQAVTGDEEPRFARSAIEEIRTDVVNKNQLWLDYWRPQNWAFFNGDRVNQPSSRDYTDSRIRWLPAEVQKSQALIATVEARIQDYSAGVKQP